MQVRRAAVNSGRRNVAAGCPTRASSFACGNPVYFADLRPGDTVLDIGVGVAADLVLAAERVGGSGRIVGIALTDEAGGRAAAAVASLRRVEIRPGRLDRLPVPDCSVDWVISNCVLGAAPDTQRAFAEIGRVLRPGGGVSIAGLVAEDLPDWVRSVPGVRDSGIARALGEADFVAGLVASGHTRVRIGWRFVYDAETIAACTNADKQTVDVLIGRVWCTHIRATRHHHIR